MFVFPAARNCAPAATWARTSGAEVAVRVVALRMDMKRSPSWTLSFAPDAGSSRSKKSVLYLQRSA